MNGWTAAFKGTEGNSAQRKADRDGDGDTYRFSGGEFVLEGVTRLEY